MKTNPIVLKQLVELAKLVRTYTNAAKAAFKETWDDYKINAAEREYHEFNSLALAYKIKLIQAKKAANRY